MRYQLLTPNAATAPTPSRLARRFHPRTKQARTTRTRATGNGVSFVVTSNPNTAPTAAIRQRLGFAAYRSARRVRTAPNRFTRLSFVTNDERNTIRGNEATNDAATTGVHSSVVICRTAK